MPRSRQPIDLRLLNKVSRYYYEENKSEGEISVKLHLSRSKVSRLLKQAKEVGIIQITIVSPSGVYPDLEKKLEEMYALEQAYVVDVSDPKSQDAVTRALGNAAAHHLQNTLKEGDVIGVSWGTTLNCMVMALQPQRTFNNTIVQIIGGLGSPTSKSHATDLCRRMASSLNCEAILLPVLGIMNSIEAKAVMMVDEHVQLALNAFEKINLAYVGIGAPIPGSVLLQDGAIMSQADLEDIISKGAMGDIGLRFFDKNGKPINSDMNERVVGITLEQIKNIDEVVAVTGGPQKVDAIRGALLGGYLDVLITDQATAKKLVSEKE